jgi:hypothetical protein
MITEEDITKIKENVSREKNIAGEFNYFLNSLERAESEQEKKMIENQIEKLKSSIKKINDELLKNLEEVSLSIPLTETVKTKELPKKENQTDKLKINSKEKLSEFDREILKRMKREKNKKIVKTEKKTGDFRKMANKLFSNLAMSMIKQKKFRIVGRDLIKANIDTPFVSYVSSMFLGTIIALVISFFIFIFFIFFDLSPTFPIITRVTENFGIRLLKIFWIPIVIPLGTFLFMYLYPSLEKKSFGRKNRR